MYAVVQYIILTITLTLRSLSLLARRPFSESSASCSAAWSFCVRDFTSEDRELWDSV